MHIDFLRLLFLVGVIWPLMQEHSLRLKKARQLIALKKLNTH